jgi:hypothetical protein
MLSIIKEIAITNITNLTSICEIQNDELLEMMKIKNKKRLNAFDYETQKYIIARRPQYFKYIKNKTFELFKISALNRYDGNMKNMPKKMKKHPEFENLVCQLIRLDHIQMSDIDDMTYKMKLLFIENKPWYLRYFDNPTDEMKQLAIKVAEQKKMEYATNKNENVISYSYEFRYILRDYKGQQTYELCKDAIEKDCHNVYDIDKSQFTKEQLEELYLFALSKCGRLIENRDMKIKKTKKNVELALKTYPEAFRYVKNQTEEKFMEIVSGKKYCERLFESFRSIWKHPNIVNICKIAIDHRVYINCIKPKYFTNEQINEVFIHYITSNYGHGYIRLPSSSFSKLYSKKFYLYAFKHNVYFRNGIINDPFLKGLVKMIKSGYFIVR